MSSGMVISERTANRSFVADNSGNKRVNEIK
jgi:hypothetical protein